MPVGDFAHGAFSEGSIALEPPWEWLGGSEVIKEVGPRPAMVLCAPATHPYGSYSCHDAGRLHATRLSGKHNFACTDTEVLVLAFLLVGFGDDSLDPAKWANAVRAAAGDFERGRRWTVPGVLRSTKRGSLRAEFERCLGAEIVAERMKAVITAVENFDGAGCSAAPLTSGVIRTYLREIRRPASAKGAAWLGVSPAGVGAQHGATLRRIYARRSKKCQAKTQ